MRKILHVMPVKTGQTRIEKVQYSLERIAFPGTTLDILSFENGPSDLEYYANEHEAISFMLEEIPAVQYDYQAVTIGCFYDPGLRELRELLDIPVLGICQSSMMIASMIGHKFSVIVGRKKWIPRMSDNANLYGFERKVASWISLDLMVEDIHKLNVQQIVEVIEEKCLKAITEDMAEVIILGCAALEDVDVILQEKLGIPVIDPVAAAFKVAESLSDLKNKRGISTSKIFDFEQRK